jgi:hypothetical protein
VIGASAIGFEGLDNRLNRRRIAGIEDQKIIGCGIGLSSSGLKKDQPEKGYAKPDSDSPEQNWLVQSRAQKGATFLKVMQRAHVVSLLGKFVDLDCQHA